MKWLIVLDPYSDKSNGIKHMHEMCHKLNLLGEEAYIAFMTPPQNGDQTKRKIVVTEDKSLVSPVLKTPALSKIYTPEQVRNDFIVIYPEVLIGNPIGAKKIVRWLGNSQKAYYYSDLLSIEKDAYVLSFSKIFHDNPNYVLFDAHIDNFFYDDNMNNRNIDLIYFGKSFQKYDCKIFENTFLIDNKYPNDRKQLALILKKCKFFYTYDPLTVLNSEALAAGAVPVFLNYKPWSEQQIDSIELGIFPRAKDFIVRDNKIYATVDYEVFNKEKNSYFNKIKYFNESYEERFIEAVQNIKMFFKV